jgi:hypothetical protein
MSTAFAPKLVAPYDGRTVMLFGVRFDYKIESASPAAPWRPSRSRSLPGHW